jgi:methylenetetrahydrofolate reductase (NADPH)
VGAAFYPEKHPEARDAETDLRHLKAKVDAGADFLISQLFFDNVGYRAFEGRARAAGITVPMIAGIMPVTDFRQIERFASMCGAIIPDRLRSRMTAIADDPQEVFWAGVSYASRQCRDLLDPPRPGAHEPRPKGASRIHFYTLNRSPATRAIFEILHPSRSSGG